MPDPKIIVPSRGRAGLVTTHKYVADIILCVAESQYHLYKEAHPDIEIVAHPDEMETVNYARKLQWILEKFANVFYLDDDVTGLSRLYVEPSEDPKVDRVLARDIIFNNADIAHQMGAYMYSFNTTADPRNYSGIKPFRLSGFSCACGLGILPNSKLYWNENIHTHYDFWISLLNAYHHRFMFVDDRYAFKCKPNFITTGGAANFRTLQLEGEAVAKLKEWFGSDIVCKKRETFRKSATHEFQITLNMPF